MKRTARTALVVGLMVVGSGGPVSADGVAADSVPADGQPRNVIVMIADGGGFNQFDAANLFESGTTHDQVRVDPATGAVEHLPSTASQVYHDWPVRLAQATFSANGSAEYLPDEAWAGFDWVLDGPTDSAASATAFGTGSRTDNGTVGFDPAGNRLVTAGETALAAEKSLGLVTSVPFNHATPAGFLGHNADRADYHGLATEIIDSQATVVMGGGHPGWTTGHTPRDPDWTWISQADFERVSSGDAGYEFIETKEQFEALAAGGDLPRRVFGLAQVADTLQEKRPGAPADPLVPGTDPKNDVPSLATMASGALNVVGRNEKGFFLLVEGGAVDWAGHDNSATRMVEEQVDFNAAVDLVQRWVEVHSSWEDTLVVVTADHETGYLTGPGSDPTWTPLTGAAGELPGSQWHTNEHTNSLVPFYARGAGSQEFVALAEEQDPVRGAYLSNAEVGQVLKRFAAITPAANLSWIWPVGIAVVVIAVMAGGAFLRTRNRREI